jgi:gluconokinase
MQFVNRHPLLVAGVSGSGKSTLARGWALRCGAPFIEGDQFHAPASVAKMRAGIPLEDSDRAAWLDRLAAEMRSRSLALAPVLACSALKRSYRERLRASIHGLRVVLLEVSAELARERVARRTDHYMPVTLVASQFSALETPIDEPHTLLLEGSRPIEELYAVLDRWLAAQ